MIVLVGIATCAAWVLAAHLAPPGPERMAIFVVLLATYGGVFHLGGATAAGTALLWMSAGGVVTYTAVLLWRVASARR
jgi:hypothetical protein